MGATVRVNAQQVFRELDRLGNLGQVTLACEQVLARQFQATQTAVHIDTGSLKNSGAPESSNVAHRWEGRIVYGGPSEGFPNDPVDYAVYERARGGLHDFRAPATRDSGQYGRIVRNHLDPS